MANTDLRVADGVVVDLDFSLRLDDGQLIATSEGQEPLVVLKGYSRIMPALQDALSGMSVGDEKDVVLAPVDGYGERDPDAFEFVPRDTFPPELELAEGLKVNMRDESGQIHKTYVSQIRPDGILLDLNHPLAGDTLHFQVRVAALRPATPDELAEYNPE